MGTSVYEGKAKTLGVAILKLLELKKYFLHLWIPQSLRVAKSTDSNDFVKVASELKSMNSQFCHMTQYPIFSRDLLADKLSDTAVLVI